MICSRITSRVTCSSPMGCHSVSPPKLIWLSMHHRSTTHQDDASAGCVSPSSHWREVGDQARDAAPFPRSRFPFLILLHREYTRSRCIPPSWRRRYGVRRYREYTHPRSPLARNATRPRPFAMFHVSFKLKFVWKSSHTRIFRFLSSRESFKLKQHLN